jgi:hypothetical protein
MKYLSDYMEQKQTKLFEENKVFFAFSNDQLDEGLKKHNIEDRGLVCSLKGGMVAPKTNARNVVEGLLKIYEDAVKEDLKENGKDKVILRELENHECFYVGDITDCVDKLYDYPNITEKDILKVYNKNYSRVVERY